MITEAPSRTLFRVRRAADGDDLRQRLLEEATGRVQESSRRELLELAAEALALLAAESEASARSTAISMEHLEARHDEELRELEAKLATTAEQVAEELRRSREAMGEEIAKRDVAVAELQQSLWSAREEIELAAMARASTLATAAAEHVIALEAAHDQTRRVSSELASLELQTVAMEVVVEAQAHYSPAHYSGLFMNI
jgi:hypothetical protein